MEQFFSSLPIWLCALLFAFGTVIIVKGADLFTEAAVNLAEATRIPKVIIGATVVSAATTLPEFAVSFTASLINRPQTAVGNAIGSTICNIGLILGTCFLIRAAYVDKKIVLRQGIFMLAAGVTITLITLGGSLRPSGGLVLMGLLLAYTLYSIRAATQIRRSRSASTEGVTQSDEQEGADQVRVIKHPGDGTASKQFLFFVIGGTCVTTGSMLLVQNAAVLTRWLGVPELIIGLTIVAIGTSLPEYVTAITSTIKGHADISVGNIIGANFVDIVWVLGASCLVRPLPIENQTRVLDYPFMLLLMGLLVFLGSTRFKIERWEAAVFLAVYVAYLVLMLSVFA